jgi:hypothetical protein
MVVAKQVELPRALACVPQCTADKTSWFIFALATWNENKSFYEIGLCSQFH